MIQAASPMYACCSNPELPLGRWRLHTGPLQKLSQKLSPSTWGLLALAVLGIAFRATYFWLGARHLKMFGDERFYFSGSADLLTVIGSFGNFTSRDVAEAADRIVDHGWFMPGMSLILLPMRFLTDDVVMLRLYIGCLNLLFIGLLVFRIDRVFGRGAALIVTALAGFFPMVVSFSFVFWGDLIGIQITLLLIIHLQRLDHCLGERGLSMRYGAMIGAILLLIVYVRPGLILMLPLLLAIVLAQHLAAFPTRCVLRHYLRFALPLIAVFSLGLAPWSAALTTRMDGFFLTTTSLQLNWMTAFSPGESFEEMTSLDRNANSADVHIRRVMDKTGLGYKQAMQTMADELMSDATFSDYRDAVRRNSSAYFRPRNQFSKRSALFIRRAYPRNASSKHATVMLLRSMRGLNSALWYTLLLVALVGMLIPTATRGSWSVMCALKGLFCALAVQPFVSAVHGRHHLALVPVIIVAVAIVCGQGRPKLLRLRDCPTLGHRLVYAGHLLAASLVLIATWLLSGW